MYHWGWSWIWGWDWSWHGDWNWAWGWFVIAGSIFGLAIGLLIEILFLLNLRGALQRVSAPNRAMPPDHVWLNLIPVFGLGWFIYTVIRIRDSLRAEYQRQRLGPGRRPRLQRGLRGRGSRHRVFRPRVGAVDRILWVCSRASPVWCAGSSTG